MPGPNELNNSLLGCPFDLHHLCGVVACVLSKVVGILTAWKPSSCMDTFQLPEVLKIREEGDVRGCETVQSPANNGKKGEWL